MRKRTRKILKCVIIINIIAIIAFVIIIINSVTVKNACVRAVFYAAQKTILVDLTKNTITSPGEIIAKTEDKIQDNASDSVTENTREAAKEDTKEAGDDLHFDMPDYYIEDIPEPMPENYTNTREKESTAGNNTDNNTENNTEGDSVLENQKEIDAAVVFSGSSIMNRAAQIIPKESLVDYNYMVNNFYVVPAVTSLRPEICNFQQIAAMDMTMEKNPQVPQILIYHSHSQERFADSDATGKTIVDVGNYLTELLQNNYGYNVIHLTDSFDLVDGVLDRSAAYTYSDKKITKILADNPSIQVLIDLHRDGVDESKHFVTNINGKETAKIMLFNGVSYTNEQGDLDYLYNPFIKENLAMTYKMFLLGKIKYPDYIRCIYISGYRYNLYHVPRSMLIEAGAQTNTYDEVINAMEPLAELINDELTIK